MDVATCKPRSNCSPLQRWRERVSRVYEVKPIDVNTDAGAVNYPTVLFSAISAEKLAWNASIVPVWSKVYAEAAGWFTKELIKTQRPWIPPRTYLNVNFPRIDNETDPCADRSNWKWVYTRELVPDESNYPDMPVCGHKYLPLAPMLIRRAERISAADFDTCYATVSLLGPDKNMFPDHSFWSASASDQGVMYGKIGHFMSCPPPFYYMSNPRYEDE